jgi:glutathione S-transferase
MSITALKLYHFPGSRSARVRWALLETYGDGFTLHAMKLFEGEQYAPEFLAKNPNHAVPVLEITREDGSEQCMLESTAMVEWLADAFAEARIAPPPGPSRERADYLQMMYFGGSWMDAMLWEIRVQKNLLPKDQVDERSIARATQKFCSEVEPQLADRLTRGAYICGSDFTAADIVIGHNVAWARAYDLCQQDVFDAYISRLAERPAYRSAFDDVTWAGL